jgi:hypothetical protein
LTPKHSRIISTVLSPACSVWLRSQVSKVEDLQVKIEGGDRQILGGYIPRVSISAHHAVYQGLHLSEIQLVGENIRINLGQVIKGKPLRLLEPIPVVGKLLLQEADLKESLQAPLLSTALTELLGTLLQSGGIKSPDEALKDQQISWQQVTIDSERLTLGGVLADADNPRPVEIRSGLTLASSHELRLAPLEIQMASESPVRNLDSFQIDLGSEVDIEELTLKPGQLMCRGRLRVIP